MSQRHEAPAAFSKARLSPQAGPNSEPIKTDETKTIRVTDHHSDEKALYHHLRGTRVLATKLQDLTKKSSETSLLNDTTRSKSFKHIL